MKYKCIVRDSMDLWLTEGKIYEGEMVISPKEFSGGQWLLLKRADDGFPCYVRYAQFKPFGTSSGEELGV